MHASQRTADHTPGITMTVGYKTSGPSQFRPVVDVPVAKVYFTARDVQVRYVLDVTYLTRSWRMEKSYEEIASFIAGLTGALPELPSARVMTVGAHESWPLIAQRKELMAGFFAELTASGAFDANKVAFMDFLETTQNFYDFKLRQPAPAIMNTTWWCSLDVVRMHLDTCGVDSRCAPAALPEGVMLCSSNSAIAQEVDGIRIMLPTPKGLSLQAFDLRLRVLENSVFYGWVMCHRKGRLPSHAAACDFMEHARDICEDEIEEEQHGSMSSSASSLSSRSSSCGYSRSSSCSDSCSGAFDAAAGPVGITVTGPEGDACEISPRATAPVRRGGRQTAPVAF